MISHHPQCALLPGISHQFWHLKWMGSFHRHLVNWAELIHDFICSFISAVSPQPPSTQNHQSCELISVPLQSSCHSSIQNFSPCHHRRVAMEVGAATSCCTLTIRMTQHQPSVATESLPHMQQQSLQQLIKASPNASATPTVQESADLSTSSSKMMVTSMSCASVSFLPKHMPTRNCITLRDTSGT